MIQACISFYNDGPELLEKAFKSVKGKVDYILAIDGRYAEFPVFGNNKDYSNDGCLDVARKYADKVIECETPWTDQVTKRTAYFTLESEKDYYFILDADEQLIGDFNDPYGIKNDAYSIEIVTQKEGHKDPLRGVGTRLLRHQEGIRYDKKHAFIWVGKNVINRHEYLPPQGITLYKGCHINHTPEDRARTWLAADGEYIRNRKENTEIDPPIYVDNLRAKYDLMRLKCNMDAFGGWDRVLDVDIKCRKNDFIFTSLEEGEAMLEDFKEGFTYHGILKKIEGKQCQPTH